MVAHLINPSVPATDPNGPHAARTCPAKAMTAGQRRYLATQVLAGNASASESARHHDVSRKFVARQTATASDALDQAFAATGDSPEEPLFWLPVTKSWIRQTALGLALTCHSSERGIVQFFGDHFDYAISTGGVHNILANAVPVAATHNAAVDLKHVRVAALDEIFQGQQPVLVGVDVASTYCFLLSIEQHRDGDTWGVRLLEMKDRGLAVQATIADFASGLRVGVAQAQLAGPCRGDHFHIHQEFNQVHRVLEKRAYRAIEHRSAVQRKDAQQAHSTGRLKKSLCQLLGRARRAEEEAINRAEEVQLLAGWLSEDILAVAGPDVATRRTLYDFIVAELRPRLANGGDSCDRLMSLLANHRDELLDFAEQLDGELAALGRQFQADSGLLRDLLRHHASNPTDSDYQRREADLHQRSRGRLHLWQAAIADLHRRTVRASSVVENLNSRLRGYFFLRRHLGVGYLQLLQFYLNHRAFARSQWPDREGESPRQMLTGEKHPHWVELLGYKRFQRD
jgi:hypothetical protein